MNRMFQKNLLITGAMRFEDYAIRSTFNYKFLPGTRLVTTLTACIT